MSAREQEIERVLDRLSRLLPERAPALWAGLRPPVAAADLHGATLERSPASCRRRLCLGAAFVGSP